VRSEEPSNEIKTQGDRCGVCSKEEQDGGGEEEEEEEE
jgi:hypothetical protein